jgi:O-antigen/teichoic acid export membrane protein
MDILQKNILANFVGRASSMLLGLVTVPFYIRFLGVEAYGLIGVYTTILGTISLMDFGLSLTVNRELASASSQPQKKDESRDFLRTMETIYWVIGILIGIGVCILAPLIATKWVKVGNLSTDVTRNAVVMMGILVAFQWPSNLYMSGLIGLQRQVLLNWVLVVMGAIKGFGVLLVFLITPPTITIFFLWQILITIIQVVLLFFFLWRNMPKSEQHARFRLQSLQKVWRFTAGMGLTGIATFFISQLDKVVLSKTLRLDLFGYYNVANQVNTASKAPAGSIFVALFPRFNVIWASGDEVGFRKLYHQASQFVSLVVLPASAILVFFSYDLVRLWTGSTMIAQMASPIVSLLVLGTAVNSMNGIPHDITIVRGMPIFGFYQNIITAAVMTPLMLIMVTRYGGIGAAIVWLATSVGYTFISAPIIHHLFLKGELRKWYLSDVGAPFVISFLLVGLCWLVFPKGLSFSLQLPIIFAAWLISLVGCTFVLPEMRGWVFRKIGHQRG